MKIYLILLIIPEYHNLLKNIISKNKIDIRYDDEKNLLPK